MTQQDAGTFCADESVCARAGARASTRERLRGRGGDCSTAMSGIWVHLSLVSRLCPGEGLSQLGHWAGVGRALGAAGEMRAWPADLAGLCPASSA